MKRNGIVNLLRCWFNERFGETKPYKEIIPRNYFHALQMNAFSIVKSNKQGEGIDTDNQEYEVIVLPYDEQYELIQDDTMLEIVNQWIELECKNKLPNQMKIAPSIRGAYIADTGEIFNQSSICILLSKCEIIEIAELAIVIKNKLNAGIVLFQSCGSYKIYGV